MPTNNQHELQEAHQAIRALIFPPVRYLADQFGPKVLRLMFCLQLEMMHAFGFTRGEIDRMVEAYKFEEDEPS